MGPMIFSVLALTQQAFSEYKRQSLPFACTLRFRNKLGSVFEGVELPNTLASIPACSD